MQLYAEGSHLWKQLVQQRYDRFLESDKADWKYIYQSRNWAEKKLRREDYELLSKDIGVAHRPSLIDSQPIWKVSGDEFLSIVRDMVIENGQRILLNAINFQTPKITNYSNLPHLSMVSGHNRNIRNYPLF